MRIGLSTACYFNRLDTEDALSRIIQLGAPVCEIFLNTYSEFTEEFTQILRERIGSSGVTVASIHTLNMLYEPQLFSSHKRQCEDAYSLFERVLRLAHAVGAEHCNMHGAYNARGDAPNMARYAERVDKAADFAGKFGIKLALENVMYCHSAKPEFFRELRKLSKSPNLYFNLDVKQAAQAGRCPVEYVQAMGDRLSHIHLCDYTREGKPRLPGQGEADFIALSSALRAIGYSGNAVLEVYMDSYGDDSELADAMKLMQDVFAG